MKTHRYILAAGLAWLAAGGAIRAEAAAEMVRADWYFRESLVAIRDWEAILAQWSKTTPEAEQAFVFPVPQDGARVAWPNPIPLRLLPGSDALGSVAVRWAGERFEITRTNQPGLPATPQVAAGQLVTGYWHPGGGAKDHWYHAYHRRFDAAGRFYPKVAPFALQIQAPLDLRRGSNSVAALLRNATAESLPVALRWTHFRKQGGPVVRERDVTLPGGAQQSVNLPVELPAEEGSFLVLTVKAGGVTCRIPLLAHVENTSRVLASIGQVLQDTPDPAAAATLARLQAQAGQWPESAVDSHRPDWRGWFEAASELRDRLLLRRIQFGSLLFLKRKPFDSEQPYMDAHHLRNPPGGSLCRLSPVRPDGQVIPVVDSLGEGVYRDVCLHWEGRKILFSFGNGSDLWDGSQSYHLYEADLAGGAPRQLTFGPKNDCEPFYLPNGQIGFTSDRSEHFVMCGAARHVANLHVMEQDGSSIRQLSFNTFNDFNPSVLPDGRIIYSRWEYNERSVTSLHHPFTMHPDGTMMAPYYGNATIRPNVVMFTRPVPESTKVMALFTGHHGQTHGPIGLIDRNLGVDGPKPIQLLTPDIPVVGEKAEDSQHGWFSDPWPLAEDTYLCSFTPTVVPWLVRSWAIYLGDRHGNLALVYRDPDISCAEPVPLVPRPAPAGLARKAEGGDAAEGEATLIVADIQKGLSEVPREVPRYLRIIEDIPRKGVHEGGVVITSGSQIYTVKRVIGTVPIEPDGSAFFKVPANRNLYFEVLDANQLEIQRMRSVVCLKPGENRTCVGCHEHATMAPPNRAFSACRKAPTQPVPPAWGQAAFSFLRDLQPILNARCAGCHTFDRQRNRVILTGDLTDRFTVAYEELLPYLKLANSMRWDHPDDVYARPPYTYGSQASLLTQLLAKGHHGVTLTETEWIALATWIDLNAPYYDRYESVYGDLRSIFTKPVAEATQGVFGRRCASCHGAGDGRQNTWWLSLNHREPARSRALMAPLARPAGGWGRCGETVFTSTNDPDYQLLLKTLGALGNQLAQRPREDVLSLRGTSVAGQRLVVPEPPAPRRATAALPPPGHWVYLSDLPWQAARAGWSPNGDGLPRRDRDIEGQPLRLGGQVFSKGLGTHAPSRIVFRLDGAFDRFWSQAGVAEAGGTAVFQVYLDDTLVYDSGRLPGNGLVRTVDLPIPTGQVLRLEVTDAGDGISADMANWAGARLRRRELAKK